MKYSKDTPRITVKFINGDTDQILFEIKDRSWMTVGEIFTDHMVSSLIEQELKGKKLPKNLLVLAVGEYKLI
jgi:hypothetical protein